MTPAAGSRGAGPQCPLICICTVGPLAQRSSGAVALRLVRQLRGQRSAARSPARIAARGPARSAAPSPARSADRGPACSAAGGPARSAARGPARSAARSPALPSVRRVARPELVAQPVYHRRGPAAPDPQYVPAGPSMVLAEAVSRLGSTM
jgi:hypothetical protein